MPTYQIRLQGHLAPPWAAWFADLTITLEADGVTRLTGPIADQAALYGLLKKIYKLGLPLLSVTQLEENAADEVDSHWVIGQRRDAPNHQAAHHPSEARK